MIYCDLLLSQQMFFPSLNINKLYDYLRTKKEQQIKNKPSKQPAKPLSDKNLLQQHICLINGMPPQERNLKQNQYLWIYFEGHPFFSQVQHHHSIYAKVMSIALLSNFQLEKQKNQQLQINDSSISFKHKLINGKYVVLMQKAFETATNSNELQKIRQIVEKLQQYNLIKNLQYEQLLYLAHNSTLKNYKFKQYLFKSGSPSSFVYFIERGEFHYIHEKEEIVSNHNRYNSQKIYKEKSATKKNKLIHYEEDNNPNKIDKKKIIQHRIAIVNGGQGSTIGEQQVLNPSQRLYSVICMSTQNSVLRVKSSIFHAVAHGCQFYKDLRKQAKKKHLAKAQFVQKIQETQNNISSYMRVIQKSIQLKESRQLQEKQLQKSRVGGNQTKLSGSQIHGNTSKKKAFSNILMNSRLYQKSTSATYQIHKKIPTESVDLTESQIKSQLNSSFALTGIQREDNYRKLDQKKIQEKRIQQNLIQQVLKDDENLQKYNHMVQAKLGNSIGINSKKNQNRIKFTGMIDADDLIKRKQHIAAQKNTKILRKNLFPEDFMPVKNTTNKALARLGYQLPSIQAKKFSRQKNQSVAHSKQFMQKLLIDVLQKSGYNPTIYESQGRKRSPKSPKSPIQQAQSRKKNKRQQRQQTELDIFNIQTSEAQQTKYLLEENQFDKYFYKF